MGWMQRMPTWTAGLVMAVAFAVAWFGTTFLTTPETGLGARALTSAFVGACTGSAWAPGSDGTAAGTARQRVGRGSHEPSGAVSSRPTPTSTSGAAR